jgi:hypothetical protein
MTREEFISLVMYYEHQSYDWADKIANEYQPYVEEDTNDWTYAFDCFLFDRDPY